MKQRIRVNYNKLVEKISNLVGSSKSQYCKDYGDSILWGLMILGNRLADIANIAIAKDYTDIIELFQELGIITSEGDEK